MISRSFPPLEEAMKPLYFLFSTYGSEIAEDGVSK